MALKALHVALLPTGALAAALAAALTSTPTPPASACSCIGPGPVGYVSFPSVGAHGFPTNGAFVSFEDWRDVNGTALDLSEDYALTALFQRTVRRPTAGTLTPGATYYPLDDCPATGECVHQLHVAAGPDTTPPSRAVLRSVVTHYITNANASTSPCVMDSLTFKVDGTDDTTPPASLGLAVYVARDEAGVGASTTPDLVMGWEYNAPLSAKVFLGAASTHARSGAPLREAGRFCFAAALVDWAANVGERSDVTCLDTSSPTDPTVVRETSANSPCGSGCASRPGGASGTRARDVAAVSLTLAALAAAMRRRRAFRVADAVNDGRRRYPEG